VRIAFPHLVPQDACPERRGELYEKAIRPSALAAQTTREAEWPASFELACLQSRKPNGTIVSRANLIAAHDVASFGTDILHACNEHPDLGWARGAFFIHQIKGVKAATSAPVDQPDVSEEEEAEKRRHSLDALMDSFVPDPFDAPFDQAYVDVGLEVSRPGFVLHWDKASHSNVTDFLIEDHEAAVILTRQGRRGYWCDNASLLASTAGFRVSVPHNNAGPMGTTYIQAYCTDKHIGSVPGDGEVALQLHGSDVLAKNKKYSNTISKMYHQALAAATSQVGGNARLEARVKLEFALDALPIFDVAILTSCVLSYPAASWW
jgi:hypothetical protein